LPILSFPLETLPPLEIVKELKEPFQPTRRLFWLSDELVPTTTTLLFESAALFPMNVANAVTDPALVIISEFRVPPSPTTRLPEFFKVEPAPLTTTLLFDEDPKPTKVLVARTAPPLETVMEFPAELLPT
jgi:hypothetical protein